MSAGGSSAGLVIKNRLSAPAEIDLTGVKIVYSGGSDENGVWVDNASNLYIFGETSHLGYRWRLFARLRLPARPLVGLHRSRLRRHRLPGAGDRRPRRPRRLPRHDLELGQNLAWDPHAEKGTGLHGANLWDANSTGNFTNNRFAFYAHDIPVGACVEFGNAQPSSQATGNVLYLKCVNATDVSTIQTGGNALQVWGDTNTLGLDVKYLEGDNLQGFAYFDHGISSGQTAKGVTIEYGSATNTNQNPRYADRNPWQNGFAEVFQNLLPAP